MSLDDEIQKRISLMETKGKKMKRAVEQRGMQDAFQQFARQHDLDDQQRLDLLVWAVADCVGSVEAVLIEALPHTTEQLPDALAEVWERENGPEVGQHFQKRG